MKAGEPRPLQPADDLLGHQTAPPMSQAAVQDAGEGVFTERYWYMGARVPAGDLVFGLGLGYYPNRGIMDGYAGITVDGIQYAFQASRHLGANPLETAIGPLRISVTEGMHSHRICLAANESMVTLDLQYQASLMPNDEGVDSLRKDDRLIAEVTRFVQFGYFTGRIEAGGRRFEFTDADPLWGARDRDHGV